MKTKKKRIQFPKKQDDDFEDVEEDTEVEEEKIVNKNQDQELRSNRIHNKPNRYTNYTYLTYKKAITTQQTQKINVI